MEDETPAYNALFVFGDSLSDNGAISTFTQGTFPPSVITGTDVAGNDVNFVERDVFYDGKFTNGDVYADIAAGLLNIPSDTSTFYDDFSGSNIAVGGATATDLSAIGGTPNNTYAEQVTTFQAAIAGLPGSEAENAAFLSGSAASVFIGLNDLGALGGAATATGVIDQDIIANGVQVILADIFAQSQVLAGTGVGTIILNKLPGGSFFPNANPLIDAFGPATADLFDGVSAQVNLGISTLADSLRSNGVKVEVVDFYSLAKEVQTDQETFGFLTLENALPNSDPVNTLLITDVPIAQVGFIDPVHFTQELHEVFGAFQAITLGNTQIDDDDSGGSIMGTDQDNTIFAQGGNDRVHAGDGNDLVFAGTGNDAVFAGNGDDIIFGGLGVDLLYGQDGNDILAGGSGIDILFGGGGNDVIAGNTGRDFLVGGSGSDVLIDGRGSDFVSGGEGDDFFIYLAPGSIGGTDGEDRDSFFGGSGNDTLMVVQDTPINDLDAFLAANNVTKIGIETVIALTSTELDAFDFGVVGIQVQLADLFGLI